ncbi:MerR family transcriptional regulator [Phytoactinopolyspora mesophila]|uniref:MerR family transcriptional regulator n=1 Tax=Phytoactinopolyspora mesophila TaxID=2650750 RepID=A0A7K3LXG3_9ACTN|nr:MerR family transcriptional regulator [Phytoactinopolyspora mesophila]NDL55675.1 MerR family transcriptional regulator [Phytoactinopolyspora mesophila]
MEELRISDVASRSGVPATTLRYYEDVGLLAAQRAANGYRVFDATVLERLRFITAAKQLGLPLDQIASLLQVWQSDPCASVKAQLRPLLSGRLASIESGIAELMRIRHGLAAAARHLDQLPERDERCSPECAFLVAEPPVACSLGSGQHERVEQWRRALIGAPLQRFTGGVRVELPMTALAAVSELAVAEQQCCPFFTFDISLHGVVFFLTITAPSEGMPMLDDLIGVPADATAQPDVGACAS